ncbi:MAG: hypothetical protein JSR76_04505 [Verrucomicrobia bacterium]|nr:hypothetical protein [Verrucomicrobiota bacterium]
MNRLFFYFIIFPVSIFSQGKLIEVCGIDGAGKTTLIQGLKKSIESKGYSVFVLKPNRGDDSFYPFLSCITSIAENDPKLKNTAAIFKHNYFSFYLLTQRENIENALEKNDFVILDRYLYSHKVYQKAFENDNSNFEVAYRTLPQADYIILLSLPIEIAFDRIHSRGAPIETYENYLFLEKAQNIFINLLPEIALTKLVHKSGILDRNVLAEEVLEVILPK